MSVTVLAGMATGTELACPARRGRHIMAAVYQTADGILFVPGLGPLSGTPRPVQCPACGIAYLVDPAAVRRAVLEGRRKYALPR